MSARYITPPPEFPAFIQRHYASSITILIEWATKEYRARLRYCAKHGYVKEWIYLHNESSPVRVLAEIPGLRRILAGITESTWNNMSARERRFIRRAYDMWVLLGRG